MKLYARRDSATSVMRKLNIKPRDYNLFITEVEGGFQFDDELAKQHSNQLKMQTNPKPKKSVPPEKKKVTKLKPSKNPEIEHTPWRAKTCCNVVYGLIKAGKTNQEIWAIIQPMFNLDHAKRNYPSWYRCYFRRIGEIGQETRVRKQFKQVIYE